MSERAQENGRSGEQVTVVIPVYNEKAGLKKILPSLVEISKRERIRILIVDDGSEDGSGDLEKEYGEIEVVRHSENKGYGAAIKTGVKRATTEWVLMMDSDGQHDPEDIPRLMSMRDGCEMVVGARTGKIQESFVNALGRKVLRSLAAYVGGRKVHDFNSGLRLFRRRAFLEFFGIYPDGFSISTTMTIAFLRAGYDVKYLPITTLPRVGGPSKVSVFRDGTSTLLLILRTITLFSPLRFFFPIAVITLLFGFGWGLAGVVRHGRFPNISIVIVVFGFTAFFFGLIADMVAVRSMRKK